MRAGLFLAALGLAMAGLSGDALAQRTFPTAETTGGLGQGLMVFGGNVGGGSGPTGNDLLLEDGSSFLLLEDGSSKLCLESGC